MTEFRADRAERLARIVEGLTPIMETEIGEFQPWMELVKRPVAALTMDAWIGGCEINGECHTAGCIAGTATQNIPELRELTETIEMNSLDRFHAVRRWLGIPKLTANCLMCPDLDWGALRDEAIPALDRKHGYGPTPAEAARAIRRLSSSAGITDVDEMTMHLWGED